MARLRIQGTAYKQKGTGIELTPGAVIEVRDPAGDRVNIYEGPETDAPLGLTITVGADAAYDFYVAGDDDYYDLLITSGRTSVDFRAYNFPLRSELQAVSDFVGLGDGGTVQTDAPGVVTNILGTPEATGIRWTWDAAPDNGAALSSQAFTYTDVTVQTVTLPGDATEYFTPVSAPGVTIQPKITAFNANGAGSQVTATAVVAWDVPDPPTNISPLFRTGTTVSMGFTPSASSDSPVLRYPFRIVSTTGDGSEETGFAQTDAGIVFIDGMDNGEVRQLYMQAESAVGFSEEVGPFEVAALDVPSGVNAPTVTPIAGGFTLTNNGVTSNGGTPLTFWTVEIEQ